MGHKITPLAINPVFLQTLLWQLLSTFCSVVFYFLSHDLNHVSQQKLVPACLIQMGLKSS